MCATDSHAQRPQFLLSLFAFSFLCLPLFLRPSRVNFLVPFFLVSYLLFLKTKCLPAFPLVVAGVVEVLPRSFLVLFHARFPFLDAWVSFLLLPLVLALSVVVAVVWVVCPEYFALPQTYALPLVPGVLGYLQTVAFVSSRRCPCHPATAVVAAEVVAGVL